MKTLIKLLVIVPLLIVVVLALAACEKDRPAPQPASTGAPGSGTPAATTPSLLTLPTAGAAGTEESVGEATPAPPTPGPVTSGTAASENQPGTTVGATGSYFTYTVVAGDSVRGLAQKFNTTPDAIVALNQLTNADLISVGQQLKIPGEAPPEYGGSGSYTVQRGDTLLSIARRFGTTTEELQKLNNLSNANLLSPGQVLRLPGAGTSTGAGAAAGTAATPQTATAATAPPGQTIVYTVRYGDTLSAIATRFGTTTRELMTLNNLTNANQIFAGQNLRVPAIGGAAAPPPTPGAGGRSHVVRSGETLVTIATRYGVTVAAIQQANNITNPNQIYPGQVLRIP